MADTHPIVQIDTHFNYRGHDSHLILHVARKNADPVVPADLASLAASADATISDDLRSCYYAGSLTTLDITCKNLARRGTSDLEFESIFSTAGFGTRVTTGDDLPRWMAIKSKFSGNLSTRRSRGHALLPGGTEPDLAGEEWLTGAGMFYDLVADLWANVAAQWDPVTGSSSTWQWCVFSRTSYRESLSVHPAEPFSPISTHAVVVAATTCRTRK